MKQVMSICACGRKECKTICDTCGTDIPRETINQRNLITLFINADVYDFCSLKCATQFCISELNKINSINDILYGTKKKRGKK